MDSDEYRAMARECYQIAGQTDDHAVRRELLWLAVKWKELAELADERTATNSINPRLLPPNTR